MKANNDFSLLNDRLDSIEKILRILVVNSITDNVVNNVLSESNEITAEVSDELIRILNKNGFVYVDSEVKNGLKIIYVETETDHKFNDFLILDYHLKGNYSVIPVFRFKKINGIRRKRFIEEQISFATGKEIHIYTEL